ncbi:Scarecrow-like protein 14 [Apostasia shenzhenica]|uniref:Scarecrow-like protein 14 n=1 Tax=Apostasia shenzhenica TaxID=1088818 RepID=A0A2I0A8V2_9ASPA|nr:Scarecrow-like protein 14 [Apostasia shenzhenica]
MANDFLLKDFYSDQLFMTFSSPNLNQRSIVNFSGGANPPAPVFTSATGVHGGSSHEDSDVFSDIVLSYINQMLMEEDGEKNLDLPQEHPALLAAEKPFYDILADTQSSSSSEHSLISPQERTPVSGVATCDIPEGLPVQQLNVVVEEAKKFLPNLENLIIGVAAGGPTPPEDGPFTPPKIRKNFHGDDDFDLETGEGRRAKQSALFVDSDVPPEMFDVLLCKDSLKSRETSGDSRKTRQKRQQRKESPDLSFLLLQCSEAVSQNMLRRAHDLLAEIRQRSSSSGDANQRLAHCFANGLEARLTGRADCAGTRAYFFTGARTAMADMLKAYQLYVAACPFKKISDFFTNHYVLNISRKKAKLHIIDFGISHGFTWPCFMQRLSTLPGGSPALRITGIEVSQPGFRPAAWVEATGRRLADYARRFNIPFQYTPIACNWESLRVADFNLDDDEALAVTCMNRLHNLADETVSPECPRDQVLTTIRELNPDVFVLGIVNGTYGVPFFATRFREALFHFSAVVDMLETNLPRENVIQQEEQRRMLEKHLVEREVMNVVACEGTEKVERPETYRQWRGRVERAGMEMAALDGEVVAAARRKVGGCYHKDFLIDEDGKWLLQGWKGRTLHALSAWRPRQGKQSC